MGGIQGWAGRRTIPRMQRLRTHGVAQSSLVLDRLALEAHSEVSLSVRL